MNNKKVPKILIGIQARSSSRRFPNKVQAVIGEKKMLEHVMDSVDESVSYLRRGLTHPVELLPCLLIPDGDALKCYTGRIAIVEGPEQDVLARFYKASLLHRPDYIVRITADCPLLPDFVISKHVRSALFGNLDYITNRDERFTLTCDGWDCEVLSKEALRWLNQEAKDPYDREHVTPLIKKNPPGWLRVGHIIEHQDRSKVKLSVDTLEDLERVRREYKSIHDKLEKAKTYRENVIVYRL